MRRYDFTTKKCIIQVNSQEEDFQVNTLYESNFTFPKDFADI